MLPKYSQIKLPLLGELIVRGGTSRPSTLDKEGRSIYEALADYFSLSEEARALTIWDEEVGRFRSKWENMVRWAKNDLRKAGCVTSPSRGSQRGTWTVTSEGIRVFEISQVERTVGNTFAGYKLSPETFQRRQAEAARIGDLGEQYVLSQEQHVLSEAGRSDLAMRVTHVSKENVAAGYDILSFDNQGQHKYIEVKSSRLDIGDFEWTLNEKRTAEKYGEAYWIYRVTNLETDLPHIRRIQNPALLVEQGLLLLKALSYSVIFADSPE